MKHNLKRLLVLVLAVLLILPVTLSVAAGAPTSQATILFTHDLHSHLLPAADEGGGEYGGYARLMTVIREQKELNPDAILVDGGDFSMGSLFQTAFTTSAIELRMMGAMGYDATTFGNHEFDYLPEGLAAMLHTAVQSGDPVPAIFESNYLPDEPGSEGYSETDAAMWEAFETYGVETEYQILERGGIYYVIFGLNGYDSDDCAPNSGMNLYDPAETAQRIVDTARAECRDTYGCQPLVVCLSHSGTSSGEGEDYELAKAVNGIDLIVSGHTHTTLHEPIEVNDTWIVSAGEYGRYLGVVQMDYKPNGEMDLTDYDLIPIDENVAEDPEIAMLVENFKTAVNEDYLAPYGMSFDLMLTDNDVRFETVDDVYATQHESTLGNVFSDAYKWATEKATGEKVDVALTASGVIRESIPLGKVTVSDVFNAASLGVGTEGELVAIYLTGADLKNALEVDASVQPLMSGAQLFMSGVEYSFNTKRMIFNKVDYAMLRQADGTLAEIKDDQMYRVVCGMYMGQMLGNVEETSFGLLKITPRDAEGNPIAVSDLVNFVVRDENGMPVKEWYAIASYLQEIDGEMKLLYQHRDGRKQVYSSPYPADLLRNANKFTYILLAVIVALVLIVILIVRAIVRRIRRKKK